MREGNGEREKEREREIHDYYNTTMVIATEVEEQLYSFESEHVCMSAWVYACMSVCVHECMGVCVYVCMCS